MGAIAEVVELGSVWGEGFRGVELIYPWVCS